MASLGTALTYPTEDENWLRTILIGGVLSVFGFLLIPLLPVFGYLVSLIQHRLEGDPKPPAFEDWSDLFADGVQYLVIAIAYMLIPAFVGMLTVGGSVMAFATGTRSGALMGMAGFAFGFLLTGLLTLVFGYIGAAGLVNFVHEQRLGAAFDIGTIWPIVTNSKYAVAWLLSVVVFIGAGVIAGALNVIPLLGAIISAFVFFYAQLVAAWLWADGYMAVRTIDVEGHRSTTEDPAI